MECPSTPSGFVGEGRYAGSGESSDQIDGREGGLAGVGGLLLQYVEHDPRGEVELVEKEVVGVDDRDVERSEDARVGEHRVARHEVTRSCWIDADEPTEGRSRSRPAIPRRVRALRLARSAGSERLDAPLGGGVGSR